jgi:DNA-binding NarL/FixJ family response regulator
MKLLAADGYIPCRGLVRTLQLLQDDVCVTAADSIDEVLARIPDLPDLDLVFLDSSMPGMENFTGLRRTVEKLPDVPVVVTSPSESPTQIISAIRNGARGYFPLSTKAPVLQHALALILLGEIYIPASVLRLELGHAKLLPKGLAPLMGGRGSSLTTRQREIIIMLGEGKSNKEIAREIKVVEGTVKLHVRAILRKLGVRNRTEAVLAANRGGYLSKGTVGMDAPLSEHAIANTGHKVSKLSERKRYMLKR